MRGAGPHQPGRHVEPGVGWDDEHVVVHLGHRALARIDLVPGRIREVPADQPVDVTVERRRQQQSLATGRRPWRSETTG